MSPRQLRALKAICLSPGGIVSSVLTSDSIDAVGKSLGGVYSSLSRQRIGRDSLILPWGKSPEGRGLRWKLNEKLITKKNLLAIVRSLLDE